MKYKVYLSGPMRGIDLYNFPAFDAARDAFKAAGFEVFSPADHDREVGFDPTRDPDAQGLEFDTSDPWEKFAKWDLERVNEADVIYMMHGWAYSLGANVERDLAIWLNGMRGGKERMLFEQGIDTVRDVQRIVAKLLSPPANENTTDSKFEQGFSRRSSDKPKPVSA